MCPSLLCNSVSPSRASWGLAGRGEVGPGVPGAACIVGPGVAIYTAMEQSLDAQWAASSKLEASETRSERKQSGIAAFPGSTGGRERLRTLHRSPSLTIRPDQDPPDT